MPDLYEYALTSDEDSCLLMMFQFFEDLGLPDDFDADAYESLSSKFYNNLKPWQQLKRKKFLSHSFLTI